MSDGKDEVSKASQTEDSLSDLRAELLAVRAILWETLALSGMDLDVLRKRVCGARNSLNVSMVDASATSRLPARVIQFADRLFDNAVAARDWDRGPGRKSSPR
jgi:hypothetical protein